MERTEGVVGKRTAGAPELPAEFAVWVYPHLTKMWRLAIRMTSSADGDDVVQEALIRAWQARAQFDPDRGSPSAWLLAITADRARRVRRRAGILPVRLTETAATSANPDVRLDLDAAVHKLAPRQRLAVACVYYVDLSVAETAAVMRCSEGTVKSTLSDARARLRTMLEVSDD